MNVRHLNWLMLLHICDLLNISGHGNEVII